ncbi:unnamed protein product [Symbiodinium natans]|uniref:MalT-like TPR region domain-containing protein n=1 Tax=Symbiodinium natans TaxID=878477 RepID=A0A812R3E7_9DINO|nr:unnamed protein product [Symbiodinium natans]
MAFRPLGLSVLAAGFWGVQPPALLLPRGYGPSHATRAPSRPSRCCREDDEEAVLPSRLCAAGDAAAASGEGLLARECYEAAVSLLMGSDYTSQAERAEVFMRIGDTYLDEQVADGALEWFEKAQRELDTNLRLAAPLRAALAARRAAAMAQGGNVLDALQEVEGALRLLQGSGDGEAQETEPPEAVLVRTVRCELLLRAGRPDDAIQELRNMRSRSPRASTALGMAYLAAQNFSMARAALQEAIAGFEAQGGQDTLLAARALRSLGVAQRELGDAALAQETLEAARRILESRGQLSSEDGSRCLLALGDAYVELDDFEEAIECFELVRLNAEVGKASSSSVAAWLKSKVAEV